METQARLTPLDRPNSYVGRSLSRLGARRAVAGRGTYTDDITLPRMVHAAFVRSPHAHARIVRLDTGAAARAPGVVKVMTGAELAKMCVGPWVGTLTCFPGMKSAPQYPMAVDRACWHGEPVVMVVAETRALAEDACELVAIDWEELPVVAHKETALEPGTPALHPELGDNLAFRKVVDTGGVDAVFAAADVVVKGTFSFGRHTAVSLEPRALVADYDKYSQRLTIHTSSQVPHMIQTVFARTLQVPEHNVRVVAPDVGGSFGLKIHTFGDEIAATAAAIVLGRPVKFIADRLESFVSDIHARENLIEARMAVSKAGEIQAFDIDVLSGAGAYSQYPRTSVFEANQILNITGGPYAHKHYRAKATVVYLNKVPTSQYRAVGHPIGNSVGEALVDMAAEAVGLDPIEIRRRNVMADDSYPRVTASGIKVQDMSHQRCLEALVARMDYAGLRRQQAELRRQGIHRGIGIAAFIKGTAPGPHGYYGAGGAPIASQDACTIKLDPGGGIVCAVGVTEQGQGVDTVMGQIAASVLGVPMAQLRLVSGDTEATPYGGGTYASRATAIGGEAVRQAATELRNEILSLAGVLLQAAPSALDIVDGHVVDFSRHAAPVAGRDRPHLPLPGRRIAERRAAGAVGDAPVPPGGRSLHLHQRYPRRPCGSRSGHRLHPPAQALGGGGLRPGDQPAARRRAGARRLRAGPGRCAVRALHLRRCRAARERHHGGLPHPDGRRDARHRRRAHPDAHHDLRARRQGRGRIRHRGGAGGGDECGERRAAPVRRAGLGATDDARGGAEGPRQDLTAMR